MKYLIAHSNPLLVDNNLLSTDFELSSWDAKSHLNFKDIDLCVVKLLNHPIKEYKQVLENLLETLKDNGFILLLQRTRLVPAELCLSSIAETVIPVHTESDLEQTFKDLNLQVICKKSDSLTSTMYLLRKPSDKHCDDVVIPIIEDKYEKWVDDLREQIFIASMSSEPKRIWLVSENSNRSGIIGLVNCLCQEVGESSIRCVFTSKEGSMFPEFSLENEFYKDIVQKNLTMNVFKGGFWGSYRHLTISEDQEKVETKHAYLNILTRGNLSSFVWMDSPIKHFKQLAGSVLCHVYYAPLNFRDVMLASGKLPPDALPVDMALQDYILGLEFSGRLENGQRVMGLVSSKGLATTVAADPEFMWEVPDNWSLEEASTVPVTYSTAYYALIMRGNLKKGESVLIHSGSGGVGQAAIAIALSLGCEVFTTVGSSEKKQFLNRRFNELKDINFCNSRDLSFEQHILDATNGKGVDVVLNSLAEEKLKASLNCLAKHGRFLEIGKYDLANNTALGMAMFLKNIAFHGILLDTLFDNDSYSFHAKKEVVQLLKDGIANGIVKPLNYTLFEPYQAEQAFRFMASGKHIGKVVLKIRGEEPQKKIAPTPVQFKALPHPMCNPEKSYIVIGGLGGFGLELCQWLVEKGARHIVLTSRSGLKTGYQKLCINRWKQSNVNVIVSQLNAAKMEEAKQLIKMAAKMKPVAAIFNAALVVRGAFMENQTVEKYKEVCESKVNSTLNLDIVSRELCPELELFVCFSSVTCVRGIAGQSNYGYANSSMERMCENRLKEGLPGLAIQWGGIADVGYLYETREFDREVAGTIPQRINSCLTVLEKFLQQQQPIVSSFIPYHASESTTKATSKQTLVESVGKIFGIKDMSAINQEATLAKLGMDSLIGTEMRQLLEREYGLVLPMVEIRRLKLKELKLFGDTALERKTSARTKSRTISISESDAKRADKIPAHYKSLSSKQLVPEKTIIQMNSVKTGMPMFVIHSIEGTVIMLKSLAELNNFPVYGIQCTPEAPSESIEQLADWYWKNIMSLNVSNTITLAGYSFGGTAAFEMCLQAERNPEKYPKVGNLIMLDSSPALLSAYIREQSVLFRNDSILEEEAKTLCSYVLLFMDADLKMLKEELMSLPSPDDRIKKSVEIIRTVYTNFEAEDLALAYDLFHKKTLMLLKYMPKNRLKKDVTLIKSSDSFNVLKDFSEKYDLEKVCDGKITVHTVDGTHISFILGKGAEEISHLLRDILLH